MLRIESRKSLLDGLASSLKENGSGGKYNLCQGGKEITRLRGYSLVLPGEELPHPAVILWLSREKHLSSCGQAECF